MQLLVTLFSLLADFSLLAFPCILCKCISIWTYINHKYLRSKPINTSEDWNCRSPRRFGRDDEIPRPQMQMHRRQSARNNIGICRLLHVSLQLRSRPRPLLHIAHVPHDPQLGQLPPHHPQKLIARLAVLRRHDHIFDQWIEIQKRPQPVQVLLQRRTIEFSRRTAFQRVSHALIAPSYRHAHSPHRVQVGGNGRAYTAVDLFSEPLSRTEVVSERGGGNFDGGVVVLCPREARPGVFSFGHTEPNVGGTGVYSAYCAVVFVRIFIQYVEFFVADAAAAR
mmetsp:Transcript_10545/g.18950  ORF Transcript_10545/g.18950 Transcript_10545/m.18950 type:complete len:280 (-) Transcript_10545:829-1668(-)